MVHHAQGQGSLGPSKCKVGDFSAALNSDDSVTKQNIKLHDTLQHRCPNNQATCSFTVIGSPLGVVEINCIEGPRKSQNVIFHQFL